ncbi:MAG TPA: hypothetical protein PKD80_04080, partial [Microthrixaceae bacterium]|nr:hypothetical protein [Microthrixaceae bacterium]
MASAAITSRRSFAPGRREGTHDDPDATAVGTADRDSNDQEHDQDEEPGAFACGHANEPFAFGHTRPGAGEGVGWRTAHRSALDRPAIGGWALGGAAGSRIVDP